MDDVKVIVTGAGAPGIMGTIYSLKKNYDRRKVNIITTDIKDNTIGKYLSDAFYVVPRPSKEKEFIDKFMEICEKENVDAILPQVTNELPIFSKYKEKFKNIQVEIGVSNYESLQKANDKYQITKIEKECGCETPLFSIVDTLEKFDEEINKFGYPKNPVVVKPPVSMGMRGLRIIDENKDKFDLWRYEKPTGIYIKKKEFINIFSGKKFPKLMIVEYLPGEEYTVDSLAISGNPIITIPRKREQIRSGITFHAALENNKKIIEYSNSLTKKLKLSYAFGYQFKLDEGGKPKILECNPRIQGTMVSATLANANIIYSALKLLLNENIPSFKIEWNTKFLRYWGGISVKNNKIADQI
jgi:carbamoyl-phosphate synthase large subunit